MKMSLHMKSYENLMTICTATSLRKLIYDFVVFVASISLVAGMIGSVSICIAMPTIFYCFDIFYALIM
jgi:hypothetical protein